MILRAQSIVITATPVDILSLGFILVATCANSFSDTSQGSTLRTRLSSKSFIYIWEQQTIGLFNQEDGS
jgi:hypothetical protein